MDTPRFIYLRVLEAAKKLVPFQGHHRGASTWDVGMIWRPFVPPPDQGVRRGGLPWFPYSKVRAFNLRQTRCF